VTLHDWAISDTQRSNAIIEALTALGCQLGLAYYASLVADNQAERGDFRAAISCIDHCLSLCRDNDEHFYEPELHLRRAMYLAQQAAGDDDGVRAPLERAAELARYQDMPRVEMTAMRELQRRFSGYELHPGRLEELLSLYPGLRDADIDLTKEHSDDHE
jgi:hypothetical protein